MLSSGIVLIGDDRVKAIPVKECGEPLTNLNGDVALLCDSSDFNRRDKTVSLFMIRDTVKEKLVQAQRLLPQGLRFFIKECYRPLWMQEKSFDAFFADLKSKNPDWNEAKIYGECSKFVAPVDVAPHSTGGALDLTLVDPEGNPLDMGTEYDAEPLLTEYATYTEAKNINREAQANRAVLVKVMSKVGFINYPTEWWHWSYGDKYWAFINAEPYAIYDAQHIDRAC